jgi:EAL domain-containing protein (putative c-di-GMP-specific phosphodiesterase class I)
MDAQTMLKHADIAMYVAKRTNSGVSIYDTNQDQHSVRRLTLEKDLHDAIENNTLKLYYQPKIDLRSKVVVSVEALLRWDHPEMGTIPPVELIEIAEQTGIIRALTLWIISTALAQLSKWQEVGLELDMAINLSMWNLQDPGLAHEIEHILVINKIAASRLELEITEGAMIADINKTMAVLNLLNNAGIQLAIDDYGTGFSSLAYLKKLPVNILKIDKSFVLGMTRDKHDNSIVHSTIELAHNLGLKVVAEGVEDKATIDLLAEMGCEIAQGYYFSRPLSQDALLQLMQDSPWGFSFSNNLPKQITTIPPTTVH